jgi:hypothetical protein
MRNDNFSFRKPARWLIDSEHKLHILLLEYAAQDVELRMYPRSVVNFAGRILTDLYSGVDLDELKSPPDGSQPLLVQSLLETSDQEMRPFNPKLIELAGRIYSHPGAYPAWSKRTPNLLTCWTWKSGSSRSKGPASPRL